MRPMPIRSLCVYCGSSQGDNPLYAAAAQHLGILLAERDIRLVYGGGHIGMMGLIADTVLDRGGRAVGVIPHFLQRREVAHPRLTELLLVDNMHQRKRKMFALADAFAVLPGGIGTLEETFEMLTWKQMRLHAKPILLLDVEGYWQPLVELLNHLVRHGFARPDTLRLLTLVHDLHALPDLLAELDGDA